MIEQDDEWMMTANKGNQVHGAPSGPSTLTDDSGTNVLTDDTGTNTLTNG